MLRWQVFFLAQIRFDHRIIFGRDDEVDDDDNDDNKLKIYDDDLNEYDNNDDDDDDELAVLFFLFFFLRSLLKQLPCLTSPWSIHLKPFLWLQGFCVQKKKKRKWYTLFYTMTTTTQHHQQNNNCRREIFCVTLKHKTIWVKTPFSYLNVKKKKEKRDTESFDQSQMS